ncbi:histidinol-phosphate transaminase [Actinomyces faecalis]|uniref:histidinol-phosphate transaminase n=1 Tax=Actinomyces faecalis TaxID=2722820 RepID=UPI0015544C48|nr:histidinol-phosphate transaminase [Actinomyces faecalis]
MSASQPARPGTSPGAAATRVHVRQAVATLPAYVPGARPGSEQVAKLSSNELPYPVQDSVLRALTQAVGAANRYPEMTGDSLMAALARRYDVDPAQVVVGNGSVALIQHLLDTVCDEGDDVVLPWRSFEAYPICIAVAGARAVKVPLTLDGRHDVHAMIKAVTERTRVVMACTPNNPTGPALTREELRTLLDGVPSGVLVLVDEAYLDFVTDPAVGDAMELLGACPNLVVSRTFSKAHALAGMRVGYLVAQAEVASAVRSVATPFGVSLPAQAAAIAALEPKALVETARRAGLVAAERDRVVDALREQGWNVPDAQGNFFWLGVGEGTSRLAEHFKAAGILVRPFAGEGVRVSLGLPEDNDRVLAAARTWDGPRG